MRPRVLVLAAPFGYGPAARSLLIAEALCDGADVTIFTNRDALHFVNRFKRPQVTSLDGVFTTAFAGAADFAPYDLFISLNNEPAVHHLIRWGLQARAVFVDSILPWRSANSPVGFRADIRAYLAQDFPGAAPCLKTCHAQTVALTAPMVWTRPGDATRDATQQRPRNVTLHLGGVTSPLVSWAMLQRPIEQIVASVLTLTRAQGRRLSVIGSRNLGTLAAAHDGDVTMLGDVSPPQAAALIGSSELLVSTPGIGAVFEAMSCGVPTLLLPPMNSTQSMQYSVFTERGYAGAMPAPLTAALRQALAAVAWNRQTACCIEFLHTHLAAALAELPRHMSRFLAPESRAEAFEEATRAQADFRDGLSRTPAVELLRSLLPAAPATTAPRAD